MQHSVGFACHQGSAKYRAIAWTGESYFRIPVPSDQVTGLSAYGNSYMLVLQALAGEVCNSSADDARLQRLADVGV